MKYAILVLMLFLVSCNQNTTNKNKTETVSAASINNTNKCENCNIELIKKISTNHAVKTKDGKIHHFCSINCLAEKWDDLKEDIDSVFVIDVRTKEFIPAAKAHYVIRAPFGETKETTAYAYKELEYANRFKKDFWGKEITNFNKALSEVK